MIWTNKIIFCMRFLKQISLQYDLMIWVNRSDCVVVDVSACKNGWRRHLGYLVFVRIHHFQVRRSSSMISSQRLTVILSTDICLMFFSQRLLKWALMLCILLQWSVNINDFYLIEVDSVGIHIVCTAYSLAVLNLRWEIWGPQDIGLIV